MESNLSTEPKLEPRVRDNNGEVHGPAIKRGELVYSMRKPARHSDVIREMADAGVSTPIGHGDDIQGFMTAYGFKDRRLTAMILDWPAGTIFSEDLW